MRHALIGCLVLLDHGCARPHCASDERLEGATCYELRAHANGSEREPEGADEPGTASMDGGAIAMTPGLAGALGRDAAAETDASLCAAAHDAPCDNGLQGVCKRSGTWRCDAHRNPVCDAPKTVEPERCKIDVKDGLDNDCDGVVDEFDELPGPAITFCYG